MFKRKNKTPFYKRFLGWLWPSSGWVRSSKYLALRIARLPDSPKRVATGVSCGVFVCFTPFFGLHFFISIFLAYILRGNVLAAFIATFFGNPITFPIIATVSITIGNWMLGNDSNATAAQFFLQIYSTWQDLCANFLALFTSSTVNWARSWESYRFILLPYIIGGIIPGLLCSALFYYLTFLLMNVRKKFKEKRLLKKSRKVM